METAKGKTREETITKLADRIDTYEKYSKPHSRLMAELAVRLARRMELAQSDVTAIADAALLHDIGLYAMEPRYHTSPGPLSFEERMDLWRHPIIGEQQMAKREATRHAQLLVRWHHEWWNGSGYPDGLAFEDIPIGARILRAVELLSAVLSDRPYRAALGKTDAIETLISSAGIECDPYLIKALLALIEELRAEAVSDESEAAASQSAGEPQPTDNQPFADVEPDLRDRTEILASPLAPTNEIETSHEPQAERSPAPDWTSQPGALDEPKDAPAQPAEPRPLVESLISRLRSKDHASGSTTQWRGWARSRYNKKALLGFEASVLRQIEFRSIAIALCGWARLDWYLKAWSKVILSNDPRGWAAAASRAMIEAKTPLGEDDITRLLQDVYVPGARLANPHLRRWFGETDAWWIDNLRRNIDRIDDETLRAQALVLGLQTGDYALSFDEQTRELRRPLTAVFWRLAGRALSGPPGHPYNRSYNLPVEVFAKQVRADLFYLALPSGHAEQAGSDARSEWRESWVRGGTAGSDETLNLMTGPQSKHTYLTMVDRLLSAAAHNKIWAIEYQEVGLASARDISELIKDHRPVRATYSKDLTEVAGGLRSYIIVAERAPSR